MLKSILLARPHPFIVSEMKPFLEANGFFITKLESPKTPVLFASMLGFEQARPAFEKIVKQVGTPVTIVGIDSANAATAQLGRQETFLYFNKEDIAMPERRTTALRLIQRHFR